MKGVTEDQANKICKEIALRANKFIDIAVHKELEEYDDQVATDLTVKLMLADAALDAFKSVSGVEYANIVRCKTEGQGD